MGDSQLPSVQNLSLENILSTAITIPGVKVNRRQFLAEAFAKENVDLDQILAVGPIEYGCSRELLQKKAASMVLTRTSQSSIASFAAGLPGGFAMAVSIPADVLQFFGMTLRLAQELTYLYGGKDLWENGQVDSDAVRNELVLYCGAMFGVSGAAAGVRLLSSQIAKTTLKKLPQKALTKTVWYPIVKQIGKAVGVKVTKSSVAKGISKAIPVIGGVISGGLNFASMMPMGNRLARALDDANFDYTEDEIIADYEEVSSISEDDTPTIEVQETKSAPTDQIKQTANSFISEASKGLQQLGGSISGLFGSKQKKPASDVAPAAASDPIDPFQAIEKLAKLHENGILTDEEFSSKKAELLSKL